MCWTCDKETPTKPCKSCGTNLPLSYDRCPRCYCPTKFLNDGYKTGPLLRAAAEKGRKYLATLAVCNAGATLGDPIYRCTPCHLDFGTDYYAFCVHVGGIHAKDNQ